MPTTVVVPNLNNGPWIKGAISSLIGMAGEHVQVVVVDDASDDDSMEILGQLVRQYHGLRAFRMPERSGVTKCLNYGLDRAAPGDVVRADGDILMLTKDWLKRLRATAYGIRDAGLVGSKVMLSQRPEAIQSFGNYVVSWWGVDDRRQNRCRDWIDCPDTRRVEEVDSVAGTLWYVRADARERNPHVDEGYHPCWLEDDDYCMMVRRDGLSVYVDGEVAVRHFADARGPRPGLEDKDAIIERNRAHWKQKWEWDFFRPAPNLIRDRGWRHSGGHEQEARRLWHTLTVITVGRVLSSRVKIN